MMPSPPAQGGPTAGTTPAVVRLGTWNMSHWTAAKAHIVATEVDVDILAVQETHLSAFPLVCAWHCQPDGVSSTPWPSCTSCCPAYLWAIVWGGLCGP
jgi:hypothetical protein